MTKAHIPMAIAASAAIFFMTTSVISCNQKAKAEQLYSAYKTQMEATLMADKASIDAAHAQIDNQRTMISRDSVAIVGYQNDEGKIIALVSQVEQIIGKHNTGEK